MHTLAARTYVNADSTKVVAEGDADAAYLLGNEGDEISDEVATRLGLSSAASVPTEPAYAKMKVDDLRSLAKERGVDVPSEAKKADLVDALEAADAAKPAETEATSETEGGTTEGAPADGTAAVPAPDATASVGGPTSA